MRYSFPPPQPPVFPRAVHSYLHHGFCPFLCVPRRGFPVQIHQARPPHPAGTSPIHLHWLRSKRQYCRQPNGYSYEAGSCQAGCLPLSKAAPCTFPDGVGVGRRKGKVATCSVDKHEAFGKTWAKGWGSTRPTAGLQLLSKDVKWQQKDAVKASHEMLQILDLLRHSAVALMDLSVRILSGSQLLHPLGHHQLIQHRPSPPDNFSSCLKEC